MRILPIWDWPTILIIKTGKCTNRVPLFAEPEGLPPWTHPKKNVRMETIHRNDLSCILFCCLKPPFSVVERVQTLQCFEDAIRLYPFFATAFPRSIPWLQPAICQQDKQGRNARMEEKMTCHESCYQKCLKRFAKPSNNPSFMWLDLWIPSRCSQ